MNQLSPSLSLLAMSIASSALTALGQNPHPDYTGNSIDPEMAKFNIDLLLLLKEKTQGNRNQEEETLFSQLLHDLQLKYVESQKK